MKYLICVSNKNNIVLITSFTYYRAREHNIIIKSAIDTIQR